MIIRFINEMGFHDHISLLSRDVENNPDLIEWAIDELYAQGCNDFEVWNPTMKELIEEMQKLQKQISASLKRTEKMNKLIDQEFWMVLNNDT